MSGQAACIFSDVANGFRGTSSIAVTAFGDKGGIYHLNSLTGIEASACLLQHLVVPALLSVAVVTSFAGFYCYTNEINQSGTQWIWFCVQLCRPYITGVVAVSANISAYKRGRVFKYVSTSFLWFGTTIIASFAHSGIFRKHAVKQPQALFASMNCYIEEK